jgi:hypothetical protein
MVEDLAANNAMLCTAIATADARLGSQVNGAIWLFCTARHRAHRQRGSRPMGRGEHALAARRRVQGRSVALSHRSRRQEHGGRSAASPSTSSAATKPRAASRPAESGPDGTPIFCCRCSRLSVNPDSVPQLLMTAGLRLRLPARTLKAADSDRKLDRHIRPNLLFLKRERWSDHGGL